MKNQFFASILTPDQPGVGLRIRRVKIDLLKPAEDRSAYGITGELLIDLKPEVDPVHWTADRVK